MSTQERIGYLLGEQDERDAIHIAVAPVEAFDTVRPGQHVSLVEGKATGANGDQHVGVVDPFLRREVKPGERFWLFLYPNTIIGLKHKWRHPSFDEEKPKDDLLLVAERVAHQCGKTYEALMDDMRSFNWSMGKDGDWPDYIMDNSERYKNTESADWEKVWQHFERVTGEKAKDKYKSAPYTCSC